MEYGWNLWRMYLRRAIGINWGNRVPRSIFNFFGRSVNPQLTHYSHVIQPSLTLSKWNMGQICGIKFCLLYVNAPQFIYWNPSMRKEGHFDDVWISHMYFVCLWRGGIHITALPEFSDLPSALVSYLFNKTCFCIENNKHTEVLQSGPGQL